ncbi:ATP-dependent DNA helicase [Metabacillus sp. GX 13764]|uniref:ATP-dependent DNA helicase n=1 Tax=Metabacillus kandeliae TaxID=2900151 RepID=UPI001E46F81E|nr:ATP-dependent DNA helicase [Metabacillus kandeliae]MCD7036535.1 ATP-dependent DNA helicase [Metabacillus kandeliae]
MAKEVKISVRHLVEYVCKSGSIESGFRSSTAMQEGTRIHQGIQKEYGELDLKEVYLKAEVPYKDLLFFVEGRCDGLLSEDGKMVIDEIKSTAKPLADISEGAAVHWAQARVYAWIYARDSSLSEIDVQLTYVQKETGEKKRFRETAPLKELEAFFYKMLEGYEPFAALMARHREQRDHSIKELSFPFASYRQGQKQFAGSVYKAISDKQALFANAPTGTGKTISTIFPSVKAMGEGLTQRIFYLTAKTITRTAAQEAFGQMREKGLALKTVTITAKDKICFTDCGSCTKEYCEFRDGYYDRVNEGMLDLLKNESALDRTAIEAYALKHKLCPFEFSLDLAYTADAVICDYNYIFDPKVSLKRLLDEQKKQTVLLVDEAHNLVDRARSMYSAEIKKSRFLNLKREWKTKNPPLQDAAKKLNDYLLQLKKDGSGSERLLEEVPEELIAMLEQFQLQAEQELLSGGGDEPLLECFFETAGFLRIFKLFDERYKILLETEKSEVRIRLFCLDPSHLLRQAGKAYKSIVYFSATLSPAGYFMDMLGGNRDEDYSVKIPSPFFKEQLQVHIHPLSTRFKDRERTKPQLVHTLYNLLEERPGNYLFFFPSYKYMNETYEAYAEDLPDADHIIQSSGMAEQEREAFLAFFEEHKKRSKVGFAVLGGVFSEGIDLKGNRLTGVVIVGVGLPQISFERNIIKDYFQSAGKNGYDYAYVYPGINKVLQAGGRLIRTEEDEGVIVLVDDRYLQWGYYGLLPEEWRGGMG